MRKVFPLIYCLTTNVRVMPYFVTGKNKNPHRDIIVILFNPDTQ